MEQLEYPFGEQSAETFQQCLFILITEEMLQSAQDHRRFLLMIADAVQRVTGKPGRPVIILFFIIRELVFKAFFHAAENGLHDQHLIGT